MTDKSPTMNLSGIDRRALIVAGVDRKAISARVDLIAHERGLPPLEIRKAKSCEEALLAFVAPWSESRLAGLRRPSRPPSHGSSGTLARVSVVSVIMTTLRLLLARFLAWQL